MTTALSTRYVRIPKLKPIEDRRTGGEPDAEAGEDSRER